MGNESSPCGFYNHPDKECVCSPGIVQKYLNKISGPLLDRIDLHVEVIPVPFKELNQERVAEISETIRNRVITARLIQEKRFENEKGVYCNAHMSTKLTRRICRVGEAGEELLKNAMQRLNLSARAYNRILKVARTIADLDQSQSISTEHLAKTIQNLYSFCIPVRVIGIIMNFAVNLYHQHGFITEKIHHKLKNGMLPSEPESH